MYQDWGDKITCLLTTEWAFIHQVWEVPSEAADLLGFENLPLVWLQLTLYHFQPVSPLSKRVGAFHLCQFWFHFFSAFLTSLAFISFFSQLSWYFTESLPLLLFIYLFTYLFTTSSGSISSPEETFCSDCFLSFSANLSPLPIVPVFQYHCFPFLQKAFIQLLWKIKSFLQCPEN